MKKIILMALTMVMALCFSTDAMAQKKPVPKKELKKVEFVTDIDCDHCVKKVMASMPYQKGVEEVKVDLPKKIVAVTFDTAKTNEKTLVKAFSKIKVKASVFTPKPAPTPAPKR